MALSKAPERDTGRPKTALDVALEFALMETELDQATLAAAERELARLRRKAMNWDNRHKRPASMGRGH